MSSFDFLLFHSICRFKCLLDKIANEEVVENIKTS